MLSASALLKVIDCCLMSIVALCKGIGHSTVMIPKDESHSTRDIILKSRMSTMMSGKEVSLIVRLHCVFTWKWQEN